MIDNRPLACYQSHTLSINIEIFASKAKNLYVNIPCSSNSRCTTDDKKKDAHREERISTPETIDKRLVLYSCEPANFQVLTRQSALLDT